MVRLTMNDIDLSTEALLKHRAIAEKATPGPWAVGGKTSLWVEDGEGYGVCRMLTPFNPRDTAAHIAANDPTTVMAHVDEILRLRSLVQEHEEYIANLEMDARHINQKIDEIVGSFGIEPDTGNMYILDITKDAIFDLQERAARLDREADWLAHICAEKMLDGVDEDTVQWWREKAREAARSDAVNDAQNTPESGVKRRN